MYFLLHYFYLTALVTVEIWISYKTLDELIKHKALLQIKLLTMIHTVKCAKICIVVNISFASTTSVKCCLHYCKYIIV